MKMKFARLGVDDSFLHDEGLGLIHTAALWRFMTCVISKIIIKYAFIYNIHRSLSTDLDSEADLTISAESICMLENIVLQFTTAVLRRVITSREEERARKAHTKAWRFAKDRVFLAPHVYDRTLICPKYRSLPVMSTMPWI